MEVHEKFSNDFTTDDLMVLIAEVLGLDCTMIFKSPDKSPKMIEPYIWAKSEEEWQNEKAYVFTMSAVDILEKLRPICLEKFRYKEYQIIEIIKKSFPLKGEGGPTPAEIEKVVNLASRIVNPDSKYITINPEMILSNREKFTAAQALLFDYFLKDDESALLPNPKDGDAITKKDASTGDYYALIYNESLGNWVRQDLPKDY
jgi:hypothetical protein